MSNRWLVWRGVVLATLAVSFTAEARVVRFIVENTRIFADGKSFGSVGQYQRLDGTAYMEVDPFDEFNWNIVNISKAPRNARGKVELSSPFFILKPMQMERGNGKIFYTINNRGNKGALNVWNFAASNNDPISEADAGDGFLMRRGFTIVDAGWQGDVAPGNSRLIPDFPVASEPNGPIGSLIRIEYSDRTIPRDGTYTLTLEGSLPNNVLFTSWQAGDLNTANASLTVREEVYGEKVPIPPDRWAFGTCPDGPDSLEQTATDICLFDGFRADRIYELIYWAINPKVMGLGYAVTRDIGSFLRYQTEDDEGHPNPLALSRETVGIRRTYSWGSSSTGMYQRDFLYLGFNEDESHRKVFDAAWINIPGSQRLFANVEFADPNTYSREDDRHDFLSTSYPPFTYAVRTDEISGITDGILKRPDTDPLVFHTDTESEYYRFRASLNVTDAYGQPIEIPPNVRMYLISSFQHGNSDPTAQFPGPRGICQNLTNPNYWGPTARALLLALDDWADLGIPPPPSNGPTRSDGTLLTLDEERAIYPAIPGVEFPQTLNELELLDFGPDFHSWGGWLDSVIPTLGPRYPILVPRTDADGLDVSGVRQMEIRTPLGTNAGWNVRAPGFRAPHSCSLSGSFIPFYNTQAERMAASDPRLSLEERYGDHRGYVEAVREAARQLIHEGFLLKEDEEYYVTRAENSDVLR